jgi:hypothetical protein
MNTHISAVSGDVFCGDREFAEKTIGSEIAKGLKKNSNSSGHRTLQLRHEMAIGLKHAEGTIIVIYLFFLIFQC